MKSPVIVTRSGIEFDILNPTSDMICLKDISHALSNLCRYTGHVNRYFSVAEHCVCCSELPETVEVQRACLLHDLAETYINDLSSPLKTVLPKYREIEERILCVAFSKYGLHTIAPWDERIKSADSIMLWAETEQLMPESPAFDYIKEMVPVIDCPPIIDGWHPEYAKKMFLRRAAELELGD